VLPALQECLPWHTPGARRRACLRRICRLSAYRGRAQLVFLAGFIPGLPSTLFRADNLPRGLTINETTGTIEGTSTSAANCPVKVTASNDLGECSTTVNLCVLLPAVPHYEPSLPAESEFSTPPHNKGLLLVGDRVSIKPTCDNIGLPAGRYSADLPFPADSL